MPLQRDVVAGLELALANIKDYDNTCIREVMRMSGIFFAELCWDMASDRIYWKKFSSDCLDCFILLQFNLKCMLWEWKSLRSMNGKA